MSQMNQVARMKSITDGGLALWIAVDLAFLSHGALSAASLSAGGAARVTAGAVLREMGKGLVKRYTTKKAATLLGAELVGGLGAFNAYSYLKNGKPLSFGDNMIVTLGVLAHRGLPPSITGLNIAKTATSATAASASTASRALPWLGSAGMYGTYNMLGDKLIQNRPWLSFTKDDAISFVKGAGMGLAFHGIAKYAGAGIKTSRLAKKAAEISKEIAGGKKVSGFTKYYSAGINRFSSFVDYPWQITKTMAWGGPGFALAGVEWQTIMYPARGLWRLTFSKEHKFDMSPKLHGEVTYVDTRDYSVHTINQEGESIPASTIYKNTIGGGLKSGPWMSLMIAGLMRTATTQATDLAAREMGVFGWSRLAVNRYIRGRSVKELAEATPGKFARSAVGRYLRKVDNLTVFIGTSDVISQASDKALEATKLIKDEETRKSVSHWIGLAGALILLPQPNINPAQIEARIAANNIPKNELLSLIHI